MDHQSLQRALRVYLVMGLDGNGPYSAYETAAAALQGGVTMLQLREKYAPLNRIIEQGRAIRELCRQAGVPFIVNDRVDVAMLLDADGVHVGQDDLPCELVRSLVGLGVTIGVSASSVAEAESAFRSGADYLGVGSIYATGSKPDAGEPVGVSLIAEIAAWPNAVPIVGIGGITRETAAEVVAAGAAGIAVISAITRQPDPCQAARALLDTVQASLDDRRI